MLAKAEMQVLAVGSCEKARRLLETYPAVEVVISGLSHPDGNWCDLLNWVVDRSLPASIVITSPDADEGLWSEALWRGAYDLLVDPYESSEVRRIVEGAARAARQLRSSAAQVE